MDRRLLATASLWIFLLSGCASWFGSSETLKPTPLKEFSPTQLLKAAWSVSLRGEMSASFVPAYHQGNIVIADRGGTILLLDSLSGKVIERIGLARELVSGVAVVSGQALVGTADGTLVAVELASGKVVWEQPLTSVTLEPPAVGEHIAVVRTNDSRLTGFDVKEGTQLWSVGRLQPPLMVQDTGSMQALGSEAVVVGMPAGKVVVVSQASGGVLWEALVANPKGATELERVTDVVSRPVFNGDQICAVAYQGRVGCFEARTGNLQWARELSSSHGLVLDAKNVYVTSEDGTVTAFDRSTGRHVWKQEGLKFRNMSAPALLGPTILVVDGEGYVHLLSPENGELIGRLRLDSDGAAGAPLSLGESVLILSRDGHLALVSLG